jgi:hypothetical protein
MRHTGDGVKGVLRYYTISLGLSHTLTLTKYEHGRRKNKKQMTEARRIPVDVKSAVEAVIEELARLQALSETELAKTETYNETVGLFFGSMYCSPQGRISGLKNLKLGDVHDIFEDGAVLTDKFKTSAKFGYQPIIFPPLQKKVLAFFLDSVRPHLEAVYPSLRLPESHLFASSRDPTRQADTAHHLNRYYIRTQGNKSHFSPPLLSTILPLLSHLSRIIEEWEGSGRIAVTYFCFIYLF